MVFLQTSGGANISAYLDPGGTYQSEIVMIIKNDLKALAFSFGMGLQFSPWEGHWIGAYFRTPAYRSYATVEETQISQQVGPIFPDGNQSQTLTTSSSYRYLVRPALCSLGYGYTRKNAWAWSLEGTLYFTDEDFPNRVINVRTGIELYLLRNVILRGGFFTDYSQKDTVTQSSSNDEKNDFYGTSLSLSIGNKLNPLRDENIRAKSMWTTVGILYQYGIGDIRGFRFYTVTPSNEMPIITQRTHRVSVFIAESIAF